jgi:hypothetical protein
MLHNFRVSRKILQKSKTLGSDILPPSRQDAKRRIKRHLTSRLCVFAGDIPILSVAALLRWALRDLRGGTFVVERLFLFACGSAALVALS